MNGLHDAGRDRVWGFFTIGVRGLAHPWVQGTTLAAALILVGCGKRPSPEASASAVAAVSSSAGAASASAARPRAPIIHVPIGPRLAALPGEGVGPIRFGATVATVERLMGGKCEIRDETACRYAAQALEFRLTDDKVSSIRIHRMDRPTGAKAPLPDGYGMFNGMMPADANKGRARPLTFGMHRRAVEEVLGQPKRVEPVTANDNGTVERRVYDGVIFEFDMFQGATEPVVGCMELVPPG